MEEEEDGGGEGEVSLALSHILHLVGVMVSWRSGSRLPRGSKVVQVSSRALNFCVKLEVGIYH